MNVAFQIARRYLFGKKNTNAINYITGISVLGIAIGTAALILILSVFNGFEALTKKHLDAFNPDIKITSRLGKFFDERPEYMEQLGAIDGVQNFSKVLEEVAHFEYNSRQQIGIIKGVDNNYFEVAALDQAIKKGKATLTGAEGQTSSVIGNGVYTSLNISLKSKLESLKISLPNRRKRGALDRDFKTRSLHVSGVYSIRSEKANQYVITNYDLIAGLLDMRSKCSAIELKLNQNAPVGRIKKDLEQIFPSNDFHIMDRLEQDASVLKIMNIEKWSSYLIFSFTLILIIFNVIGSLWMIVLDKKKDIAVLQSFGASKLTIRKIFVLEGGLISGLGFVIGALLSLVVYALQKTIGIINVPDGFDITSYPMELKLADILIIFVTVMAMGFIASFPAAWRASRVTAYVRME